MPVLALAVLMMAGAPLSAQAPAAGQPPLIDRELFFGNPEISSAALSPDGRYIAFRKPWNGTLNIWVKKADESYEQARRITAETTRPIPGFFWSRDSRFVLFVQDQGGDENYNVYAVNPAEAPPAGSETPRARNITEAKGARALIFDVPRHDHDVIFVGLNDRDPAWHDLYEVRISTGERRLLKQNTERVAGWTFDRAGTLRLATRTTDSGDTDILRVTDGGFERIYGCTVFETCGVVQFHPDHRRVYIVTNHGAPDLAHLILLDPQTGREETVESDPEKQVDFGSAIFSERTGELVATTYVGDRMRIYFRDESYEADYELIRKQLPGMEVSLAGSTADEQVWMVVASSDTEPGERHLFNRETRALTRQYAVFEQLPREHLATMTPIRYRSSDGLEIPAYLTLPKGIPPKNLPLLVVPHGGPWARDVFGYNPMAQFFANRGYAVLLPNFRGSTGFGQAFLNAGNNEWGQKMQDDLTWGVRHLVEQGIADPKRVGIAGGSYGGYAALAGVAFTPDLYAAAVSIVGPSNLLTLLESIPPYWEAVRTMFHVRMGDPTSPEGKKQLERQSPLFSAERIRTPLLVIQGANDPRVKKAESDQIVIALRDHGFPVEYLVAPDEGHGFSRPVNSMAMFATIEAFLAKHLGGRFQASMPPEVETRLGEIRVDPKTVTLAQAVDAKAVGLPDASHPLVLDESHYTTTIALGAQTIKMDSINVAVQEGDRIVVTETAKTPQGDATDRVTLDRGTLAVRAREVRQGPLAIRLTFEGGQAGGTVAMGGPEQEIDVELGGELFADGAASYRAVAALPLEEGYTATFRNFDVQRMRATVKRLRVAVVERVTVPAGSFEAWRIQIGSVEGEPGDQTVWIDTASRRVVKISATMPQAGGAVATVELVK
jgi:dipeptidyl aminopeptidase/acylaminoacyl peptidase